MDNQPLFDQEHPTPTGKMPGAPEFNEEEPTGDEQAQYDQFLNRAIDFMGQQASQISASMNDKSQPVYKVVGAMTVKIGKMILSTAKAAGKEIGPDVLHAAGQEITEHLMVLGDNAGIFPFKHESDEYDQVQAMAFLHAAEIVGNETLNSPEYTPELQDEAGNFYAQQVAGEVERGEAPEGFHENIATNKAVAMQRGLPGA